jgi:hypothetical protein
MRQFPETQSPLPANAQTIGRGSCYHWLPQRHSGAFNAFYENTARNETALNLPHVVRKYCINYSRHNSWSDEFLWNLVRTLCYCKSPHTCNFLTLFTTDDSKSGGITASDDHEWLTRQHSEKHRGLFKITTCRTISVRLLAGTKIFHSSSWRPDRFWCLPSLVSRVYRGKSGRGMKLTNYPQPMPRLRMRGAIPPLPPQIVMAWYLIKHPRWH